MLISLLTPFFFIATMASNTPSSPSVTRIACFRFQANVTAAQKGDRTAAFLDLYAEHPELLLEPPKGGRPLDTPLNLTGVKRESVWDTGFIVVFKDEAARQKFDLDPGHDRLKVCTLLLAMLYAVRKS
jgi:hypothetical protein